MAILEVTEINERSGSIEQDTASQGGRYTRTFGVQTDSPTVESIEVREAVGTPDLGDFYPFDGGSVVVSKTARPLDRDSPYYWLVTVEYDTAGSPVNIPWEVQWGCVHYQQAINEDVYGAPIVNSAQDQFDPPIEVDFNRFELTIVRNTLAFDVQQAAGFIDTVNDASVLIGHVSGTFAYFPPATLKCNEFSGSWFTKGSTRYWRVTVKVQHNVDEWTLRVLDRGYNQYFDEGSDLTVRIRDKFGHPVAKPYLLDGLGFKKETTDFPVYLNFYGYEAANFDFLELNYEALSP